MNSKLVKTVGDLHLEGRASSRFIFDLPPPQRTLDRRDPRQVPEHAGTPEGLRKRPRNVSTPALFQQKT